MMFKQNDMFYYLCIYLIILYSRVFRSKKMFFSSKTILKDIISCPELEQFKDLLIPGGNFFAGESLENSLEQLNSMQPTWDIQDMLSGLELLISLPDKDTTNYVFYSSDDLNYADVPSFISIPALKRSSGMPYAVLISGGAYGAVCNLSEALPVASKLTSLGVHCFIINYTTARPTDKENGLFPKPLDDVASILNKIWSMSEYFNIEPDNYIMYGFSAGGHLAAMWATEISGYKKYNMTPPKMLALAYPLISMDTMPESKIKDFMLTMMYGKNHTREDEERYIVDRHITSSYSPVYVLQASDDDMVSVSNSHMLVNALRQNNVLHKYELVQSGGHGFGLGNSTPAKGWVERSLDFYKNIYGGEPHEQ